MACIYVCVTQSDRESIVSAAVKTASKTNERTNERANKRTKLNEFFGCSGSGNKNHAYDTQMSIELPPSVAHAHENPSEKWLANL